ncbi:MAG: hypothetical protein AYL31_004030 [Candidatus Bathyarchaeota archaeon B26-1]|nr:MAG: hypothetical protein AYL31_004030 [Candidatus Bathyarchaeota archaeon B26-1]
MFGEGGSLTNVSLGSTIERIISKIKRAKKPTSDVLSTIPDKVYLKAIPLKVLDDVDVIKREVKSGNILIVKVSPLAKKSIDDVKRAVSELCEFTELIGGDIARLGEERVVITPAFVKIWRERTSEGETPTAA